MDVRRKLNFIIQMDSIKILFIELVKTNLLKVLEELCRKEEGLIISIVKIPTDDIKSSELLPKEAQYFASEIAFALKNIDFSIPSISSYLITKVAQCAAWFITGDSFKIISTKNNIKNGSVTVFSGHEFDGRIEIIGILQSPNATNTVIDTTNIWISNELSML
jgi:hypothetical protein